MNEDNTNQNKGVLWSLSKLPGMEAPGRWARDAFCLPSEDQILEKLDGKRLQALRKEFAEGVSDSELRITTREIKYLDPIRQIRRNLKRATELDLHGRPPIDILDLGCRSGYFLKICELLGHKATGFDDDTRLICSLLVDALKVNRVTGSIEPLTPVPGVEGRFDLVTSFAFDFHTRMPGQPWGQPEWEYFLRDVASRFLKPDARLLIRLVNREDNNYYSPEVETFFRRVGAEIDGPRLAFRRKPVLSKIGVKLS